MPRKWGADPGKVSSSTSPMHPSGWACGTGWGGALFSSLLGDKVGTPQGLQ